MGSGVSSLTRRGGKAAAGSSPQEIPAAVQQNQSPSSYPIQMGHPAEQYALSSGSSSGQRLQRPILNEEAYRGNDDLTDRLLGSGHVQETPAPEPLFTGRSNQSDGAAVAEMFAHTAMSLGMDNEDLLFNLMYFSEGEATTLGAVMEGVQQETLALHSENNTPYKLKPASETAVKGLRGRIFGGDLVSEECECQVCKDIIEADSAVLEIPHCRHFFHEECLLRWSKLQGWCPVCRAPIAGDEPPENSRAETAPEESPSGPQEDWHAEQEAVTIATSSKGPSMRLFDGDEEMAPSRGGYVEVQAGRSPQPGGDVMKPPGSTKCLV